MASLEMMKNLIKNTKILCEECHGTFTFNTKYHHFNKSKKHILAIGGVFVEDTNKKERGARYYQENREKVLSQVKAIQKKKGKPPSKVQYCSVCAKYHLNTHHMSTRKHHEMAGTLDTLGLVSCKYDGCDKKFQKLYLPKHHKIHEKKELKLISQ
tara:strand:- start:2551 stop:3015 length:465 start_codon:yes stop_codon:yes gene_type:complete